MREILQIRLSRGVAGVREVQDIRGIIWFCPPPPPATGPIALSSLLVLALQLYLDGSTCPISAFAFSLSVGSYLSGDSRDAVVHRSSLSCSGGGGCAFASCSVELYK